MVRCGAALLMMLLVSISPLRAQEPAPLDAFFGTWQGTGIAENADSLFFAVTARDLDVSVQPDGDGFVVDWTAVIRSGGDPNNPDIRRRTAALSFRPGDQPSLYVAAGSSNPLTGGAMSWARVHGRTLSIYELTLNEHGGYELTSYDRMLTDLGMELVFQRIRDGEVVRVVRGRLVKVAN